MKILKNYLALIVCFVMLVPGMSVKVDARPSDPEPTITEIKSASDMKGCYYDGTETPDNTSDDVWNEDPCFKDATLSDIVFDTLVEFYENNPNDPTLNMKVNDSRELVTKDGNPYPIRQVLYDFRGEIKAKSKGITSIKGIQFLTHAQTIDLRNNQIKDFTDLNVSSQKTLFDEKHYGYGIGKDPDDKSVSRNVIWKLGGNPFEKLPYTLGGRLVIEATQTTSSQYPHDPLTDFRFKRDNTETFSGKLTINKCVIMDFDEDDKPIIIEGKPSFRDVHVTTINFVKTTTTDEGNIKDFDDSGIRLDTTKGDLNNKGEKKGYSDTELYFTDLQTSRRQKIGIGANEEIHYETVDEMDLPTKGSQSFKYYFDPYFYVYDTISVAAEEYKPVKLKKVDSDTSVGLAGAEFQVYDANGAPVGDVHISDVNGDVLIEHLPVGEYTVKETKAPVGYDIDNQSIPFKIEKQSVTGELKISGGTSTFTTTHDKDGNISAIDYTANTDVETFIAGPLNDPIVLTKEGNDELKSIAVTYSRVSTDGTKIEDNVKETFDSVEEATVKINERKSLGHIYGSVSVMGYFEGLAEQAISLGTFENTKTPPTTPDDPGTPSRPGKPTEPTEPEEPLIPLVPAEPIEPETPTTPEVPTVPVTPTSPKVPNTSTESLKDVWGVLMGLSFIAIVGIVIKARKEN